jgi:hypothetical protein
LYLTKVARQLRVSTMSATGRSAVRDPDDFYETPLDVSRAIIRRLPAGVVLDPAAGTGAILRAARLEGREAVGIELNSDRAVQAACMCKDALSLYSWPGDIVVANPPFKTAMAFVERAVSEVVEGKKRAAAFLLRVNWLESEARAAFHRAHPADLYILSKRPSFVWSFSCAAKCGWCEIVKPGSDVPKTCSQCGAGVKVTKSDATGYAWWVWGMGPAGQNRGTWCILEV